MVGSCGQREVDGDTPYGQLRVEVAPFLFRRRTNSLVVAILYLCVDEKWLSTFGVDKVVEVRRERRLAMR